MSPFCMIVWGFFWGIGISIFSKICKNTDNIIKSILLTCCSLIKALISRSTFHCFFMFFQNRSSGQFLEGPGADFYWKCWFWCHFWFPGFWQRHLLDTIFGRDPAFHETILVIVPLRPTVFLKVVFWLEIEPFSFCSVFLCATLHNTTVNVMPLSPPNFEKIAAPTFENICFWGGKGLCVGVF